jgi:cytochrome c-type biogenesis protein CcmH/NrfG
MKAKAKTLLEIALIQDSENKEALRLLQDGDFTE